MKLKVTKTMARNMARLEEGYSVTAGCLDTESFFKEVELRAVEPASKETYIGVLSSLISMSRRAAGLTREDLAEHADVGIMEVFQIEEEVAIIPEPRVVSRIARALDLPPGKLQQLAGHVTILDPQVSSAAYKFAASSGSLEPLSAEQRTALNEFVKALAEG